MKSSGKQTQTLMDDAGMDTFIEMSCLFWKTDQSYVMIQSRKNNSDTLSS